MMKERNKRFTTLTCFTLIVCVMMFMTAGIAHSAQPAKTQSKITVVLPAEPDTLDPTTTRFTVTSAPISNNIFERLVDLTPDGKFVPGIASWKVSPDGLVVEFTTTETPSQLKMSSLAMNVL
jgi:ABC-type transport system substrate-binding protein